MFSPSQVLGLLGPARSALTLSVLYAAACAAIAICFLTQHMAVSRPVIRCMYLERGVQHMQNKGYAGDAASAEISFAAASRAADASDPGRIC